MNKKSFSKSHPDFITFFDKISWAAMALVAAYAANQLSKIGENVAELNKNIAVIASKMQTVESDTAESKEHINQLEKRVTTLEIWRNQ